MDMHLSVVDVTRPLWFGFCVTCLAVFALFGLLAVRASARPALMPFLAPAFAFAASFIGLTNVARSALINGGGLRSTSAGFAEAAVLLVVGFLSAAFLSFLSAATLREGEWSSGTSIAVGVIWCFLAGFSAAEYRFGWQLAHHPSTFAKTAQTLAQLGAAASVVLFLMTLIFAFQSAALVKIASRLSFVVNGVMFSAGGYLSWMVVEQFRAIARG
jgi:hypothetical protein